MTTQQTTADRSAQAAELREWYLHLRRRLLLAVRDHRIAAGKAEAFDRMMIHFLD